MRVAVWQNTRPGGAKRVMQAHVAGLVARGHHVEVWQPPDPHEAFMAPDDPAPRHVVPLALGEVPPWFGNGRAPQLRSPRRAMSAMAAHARRCAAEMTERGFDVCLAGIEPYFSAPPIARWVQIPSVLYLQEPNRWLYEARPQLPWVAPRQLPSRWSQVKAPGRAVLQAVRLHHVSRRARFELDNALAFDEILVNSRFSQESVRRAYGCDSTVCWLGVDAALFAPTGAPREDVVAGVGNVMPEKRVDALVAAVARIATPRPRVEWVGAMADGAYRARVEQLARDTGVELTFREAADDETLVDLLNRARVVVYTPRLEPFGLVPLEAGACAAPVIGIAQGGVRETVVDGVNGLLVDDDGEALTAALQRLLADPQLAARLGREGRRIVEERWTLDAANDRLEARLEATLARYAGRSSTSV